MLGGERGRRLLDTVEARAGEYFTPTGREKATLADRRKRVEELEEEYAVQESALGAYDQDVNRLDDLRKRVDRYERDGSLAAAKAEAVRADEAAGRLLEVEAQIETARARMGEARANAEAARSERDRRAGLVADAAEAEEEVRRASAASEALEPVRVEAERSLIDAERRLAEANTGHETAAAVWQSARRARERTEITDELQKLESRLGQAESTDREIDLQRQALAANSVNDDLLARLRDLSLKQANLKAALDAAAAALMFVPETGMAVSLDGQPVDTNRQMRVTEKKMFRLQGFGAMEVTPGGQDIARLRADRSPPGTAPPRRARRCRPRHARPR